MNKESKAQAKAKKIQCFLGIFFLIPPILGVIAFVFNLLGSDGEFARMSNLSYHWVCDYGYASNGGGGGGMSAAPIYLGMMAMVGAYLIKDSMYYFFIEEENKESSQSEKTSVVQNSSKVQEKEEKTINDALGLN